MKKSFIKTGTTHTIDTVDMETGEIVATSINKSTYLVNTKEEFFLMYSSMVMILKGSSDVRMKLFASLLERNAEGKEFAMNKSLKEVIAEECGCKPRSFDAAFTSLVKDNIVVKVKSRLYKINPRHVFKGHSNSRNRSLKAIIELGCVDC